MSELRELRVYMLGVGIVACVTRIAMILAEHVNMRSWIVCAENALFDLHLLWSSYWS